MNILGLSSITTKRWKIGLFLNSENRMTYTECEVPQNTSKRKNLSLDLK